MGTACSVDSKDLPKKREATEVTSSPDDVSLQGEPTEENNSLTLHTPFAAARSPEVLAEDSDSTPSPDANAAEAAIFGNFSSACHIVPTSLGGVTRDGPNRKRFSLTQRRRSSGFGATSPLDSLTDTPLLTPTSHNGVPAMGPSGDSSMTSASEQYPDFPIGDLNEMFRGLGAASIEQQIQIPSPSLQESSQSTASTSASAMLSLQNLIRDEDIANDGSGGADVSATFNPLMKRPKMPTSASTTSAALPPVYHHQVN